MNQALTHAPYDPSVGHSVIEHRWDALQGCRLAMYCPACGVLTTLRAPTEDEERRYHAYWVIHHQAARDRLAEQVGPHNA